MTSERPPIPVTVIGGYLGAGKTTLLNHLLRRTEGARLAVLVNDFGSINIDAELIESFDGQTMQLANGCICCSLAGGFADALFTVRDLERRPDRVLVEASGVADPVVTAQYAHLDGFELDGVIVVADAETVRSRSTDRYVGRHVLRQLAGADVVVLNKTDLVAGDRLAGLRVWVDEHSTGAVIETVDAAVSPAFLFGVAHSRAVDGVAAHGAVEPVESAVHETWTFTSDRSTSPDRLTRFVASLPDAVVRGKGFVFLGDDPLRRSVLQLVGRRWSLSPGELWGDETPSTRLVFVGLPDHHLATDLAALSEDLT